MIATPPGSRTRRILPLLVAAFLSLCPSTSLAAKDPADTARHLVQQALLLVEEIGEEPGAARERFQLLDTYTQETATRLRRAEGTPEGWVAALEAVRNAAHPHPWESGELVRTWRQCLDVYTRGLEHFLEALPHRQVRVRDEVREARRMMVRVAASTAGLAQEKLRYAAASAYLARARHSARALGLSLLERRYLDYGIETLQPVQGYPRGARFCLDFLEGVERGLDSPEAVLRHALATSAGLNPHAEAWLLARAIDAAAPHEATDSSLRVQIRTLREATETMDAVRAAPVLRRGITEALGS